MGRIVAAEPGAAGLGRAERRLALEVGWLRVHQVLFEKFPRHGVTLIIAGCREFYGHGFHILTKEVLIDRACN